MGLRPCELEIANLAANAKLEMVLTISRGRGYVLAEGNKGPNTVIGVIPVDLNFSPVRRVRYEVGSAAWASGPTTTS